MKKFQRKTKATDDIRRQQPIYVMHPTKHFHKAKNWMEVRRCTIDKIFDYMHTHKLESLHNTNRQKNATTYIYTFLFEYAM